MTTINHGVHLSPRLSVRKSQLRSVTRIWRGRSASIDRGSSGTSVLFRRVGDSGPAIGSICRDGFRPCGRVWTRVVKLVPTDGG